MSALVPERAGWMYLGEEPYFFDHWGYGEGLDFRQIIYDYGAWHHRSGQDIEPDMENIDKFVSDYPPGWYWSGHTANPSGEGAPTGAGPFSNREAAMLAAETVR